MSGFIPLSSPSTLERTDNAVSGLISTNGGFNFGSGSVDYVYVSNQYLIILRLCKEGGSDRHHGYYPEHPKSKLTVYIAIYKVFADSAGL